jgi:hypothetical protein
MTTITDDNPAGTPAAPPAAAPKRRSTVAAVLSSILGLFGVTLLIGGAAVIAIHGSERDADGYYSSGTELVESSGYAITTDEIDLGADPTDIAPGDVVSSVRLGADGTGDQPLFVGIARTADVEAYLGGVDRSVVTDFRDGGVDLTERAGGRPAGNPADENIWDAQSEGTGRQTVEWEPQSGSWSAVVMNADATRGVSADLDAGADIGWLIWVGIGLAGLGLAMTAGGGFGFYRAIR